jgi:hypothetical protein
MLHRPMRTIVHNPMRMIVLMLTAKHGNDRAQGVPILSFVLSVILNYVRGEDDGEEGNQLF